MSDRLSLLEVLGRMATLTASVGRPQGDRDHEYTLTLPFQGSVWRCRASIEPTEKDWSRG